MYDLYLPVVTVLALVGLVYTFRRERALRPYVIFLLGVALLTIVSLLVATSRINVSQGRILYPGIAAFAILFVLGWRKLLGRRIGGLIVVPLATLAVVTPLVYLVPAFPQAQIVSELPSSAQPVNISAGNLTILGYERLVDTVSASDSVRLKLYLRGSRQDNPSFFIKALYPLNDDVLGGVDTYPGMMPTRSLQDGAIYAVPLQFRLDRAKVDAYPAPYQIQITLGWRARGEDRARIGRYLPLQDGEGLSISTPILAGPTVLNDQPASTQYPTNVLYGDLIRLSGYTVSTERILRGQPLAVTLRWQDVQPMERNWVAAVGLLDANGQPLTTSDGSPVGYPTSAWRQGPDFSDPRILIIPDDAVPGVYSLYIGWYQLSDGTRLRAVGDHIRDDLFITPQQVTICADALCLNDLDRSF